MAAVAFPNESPDYRRARDELLEAEQALRAQIEAVAVQRRQLPPGGVVPTDYGFTEMVDGERRERHLSELFGDHDTLFAYSLMYGPDMDGPCPMCTSMLDGLDGQVGHIDQSIATAVVAKHDIDLVVEHGRDRGWDNLRLLSSAGSTYNADYHGEVDGHQMSAVNVFVRDGEQIRHFWHSEMGHHPPAEGQNMRHVDALWPLYNVLDLTPTGREDFYPRLDYHS